MSNVTTVCGLNLRVTAMRHDPAAAAVVIMLRSLKMYGMAQAVTDLTEQGAPAFEAAVPILSQLLKAEMAEREVRSIRCPAGDACIAERGLPHEGGALPGIQRSHRLRLHG
jgi:hypothetical protein